MEATHTSDRTAGVALGTNCSNYVDTNNDGICDNCRGAHQSKSARDGSGNNGVCGNCGSNSGCGGYIDANNDGACDNYDGACGNGGAYCDGTRHNENAKMVFKVVACRMVQGFSTEAPSRKWPRIANSE